MGLMEVIKKLERERGAVQKSREVIEILILELKLTDEAAARIAGVDVDFARKVRKELNQK